MSTVSPLEARSTVSGLSDDQLLEQTDKLARLDHQVQVVLIDHLCEIDARQLYLRRGYSSPFDYVTSGLGYSAGAAWRRFITATATWDRLHRESPRMNVTGTTEGACSPSNADPKVRNRPY